MAFSVADGLMASPTPSKTVGTKPSPLRFNRAEDDDESTPTRPIKRANTYQNGTSTTPMSSRSVSAAARVTHTVPDSPDAFETTDNEDGPDAGRASVDLDELPIELVSLTDR